MSPLKALARIMHYTGLSKKHAEHKFIFEKLSPSSIRKLRKKHIKGKEIKSLSKNIKIPF